MDKRDGHTAFAHATRYSLDRVMARVPGAEDAWQARLQRERLAIEFPGGEFASCASIAAWIPLDFNWQPRRAGIGADHHKQGIGFVAENFLRLMRRSVMTLPKTFAYQTHVGTGKQRQDFAERNGG